MIDAKIVEELRGAIPMTDLIARLREAKEIQE